MDSKVKGMGVFPLTSTPSISEMMTGLKGLDFFLSSYTNFLTLLAIEDDNFGFIIK